MRLDPMGSDDTGTAAPEPVAPASLLRWRGARLRLGAAFFALALVIFTAVGLLSGHASRRQAEADSALALAQTGGRLALALDAGLAERRREIENLAVLESMIAEIIEPARWQKLLERQQSSLPYYSWIGVADADGRVLAATGGLLEGQDVSGRPWFREGRQQPWIGDVHGALLLSRLLPSEPGGGPLRLLDFAAPWRRDGRPDGVVGAHLNLRWAEDRRQVALAAVDPRREIELLLLGADGTVLLGPQRPAPPGGLLRPGAAAGADGEATHAALQTWGDGNRYLTATLPAARDAAHGRLGWTVVARQPAATALATAVALQYRLWAVGAIGAALFGLVGWWLAGRLTEPLARLAQHARQVSAGPAGGVVPPHDEVKQLAHALHVLNERLEQGEQALADSEAAVEARVRQRTHALQQANDDLQSYSRNISHDLKGPIGGVAMVLRLLREQHGERLDDGARRSLDMLVAECERLHGLVDELLALAMVEQRPLQRQAVSMREVVEDVLQTLRSGTQGAALRRATVVVGALPEVPADPVLVRQVWHNLLANAVKFSARAEAPRIEVSAQPGDGDWRFCVADNGAGFDMSQARRLFGVFQRLHRASDFAGTGVGLSIVKRVVQGHGGRVGAEGEPGRGARFWFTLPADAPLAGPAPAPSPEATAGA